MVEKVYSVAEAATTLKVSTHTIRAWFYSGKLPGIKLGRRVVFSEKNLQELLDRGKYLRAR